MYTVILEPSAQRDMKKLTGTLHQRMVAALRKLEAEPRGTGTKKLIGFENQWRLRVGMYRVLYEINDDKRLVHIIRVVPRSRAYT